MTGSHDGFHRVWNLEKTCLGEMQLPNLTEKMKKPKDPILERGGWKFILERMKVTEAHRDLADRLKAMIKKYGDGRAEGRERRNQTQMRVKHIDDLHALHASKDEAEEHEDEDEADKLRRSALEAMVEEIGPRHGPPLALPSDDELRLRELEAKLNAHAKKTTRFGSPSGHDQEDSEEEERAGPVSPGQDGGLPRIAPRSGPVRWWAKAADSDSMMSSTMESASAVGAGDSEAGKIAVSPIRKVDHFGMNTKKALYDRGGQS